MGDATIERNNHCVQRFDLAMLYPFLSREDRFRVMEDRAAPDGLGAICVRLEG
jgi:hypothetical protein